MRGSNQMILTGKEIDKEIFKGNIKITGFQEENLNPNSYDVTLANEIAYYTGSLDMKEEPNLCTDTIPEEGYMLYPGRIYLARTNEKTITKKHAPMIEGRSSVGRLGIQIHSTAGFGDVGFDGYWTLEISVVEQVKIYPNVRIGQVYFYEVKGEIELYDGKYQNNSKLQASKMYEDFATDTNVATKEPTESDLDLMGAYHVIYECKWFAKDSDGDIYAYTEKPEKVGDIWEAPGKQWGIPIPNDFSHISWEDDEPYEYKPKEELKVGDVVWWYDPSKQRAVCDYIDEILINEYNTRYKTIENERFNDSVLNTLVFLTKEECEANYNE